MDINGAPPETETDAVQGLNEAVGRLEVHLTSIAAAVWSTRDKVERLLRDRGQVGSEVDQTAERLNGSLQDVLAKMTEQLSAVQHDVVRAGGKAEDAITDALEDILTRLDHEPEGSDAGDEQLGRIEKSVADLIARTERANGARADEDRFNRMEAAIEALGQDQQRERQTILERLDQLAAAQQPPGDQIEALTRQLAEVRAEVGRAKASAEDAVANALEDILSRLDRGVEVTIDRDALAAAMADTPVGQDR